MTVRRLRVVPLTLAEANELIANLHRHHKPVVGHRFSLGAMSEDGLLVGAVVVGRPVARGVDYKSIAEVTRLVTDGTNNACSLLYGAAARAAKAMGYDRIQTYILASEPGTSLRASGWTKQADVRGRSWSTPSRPREDKHPTEDKERWTRILSDRPDTNGETTVSRASELEAARLAAERTTDRCRDLSRASIVIGDDDSPADVARQVIASAAAQMLAEATYVAEQRKSGWKSRSDAHTAAGRILEQWAKDLAAYLERDKPPMRPPLDTITGPTRHAHLDPADGPISAQITSGLLSQATDGPVTADVARSIREAKTVDDKLDVAFGPPRPLTQNEIDDQWPDAPEQRAEFDAIGAGTVHITAAPANYAWCDATSGLRGYVGSATCPDCIARYDAYDEAANKALALTPPAEFIPVLDDPATDGSVMIPQFSEPGAPPPRQTQQRLTFAQVREHGQARARGVDHRSYSQVQAFKECGVKYALSDLDTPAWWNVGGTALHYACEWLNRETHKVQALEYITDNTIETLWANCLGRATSEAIAEHPTVDTAHWRAAKKGTEGYDWWRVNGVDMVRRWVTRLTWLYDQGWRIAEFNGVPAIEYDCPMWIGSVKVENIIDLVMTRDDGTLLIVDAKSGASAPDDTAQLGQYAHALARHRVPTPGMPPFERRILGAYWLARTDVLTNTNDGPDLRELHPWDELEYLITTMDAAERQGLYLPNKSKSDRFGCGSCGVRGLCPVGPS